MKGKELSISFPILFNSSGVEIVACIKMYAASVTHFGSDIRLCLILREYIFIHSRGR
jgi:hypothetical protein